MKSSVSGIGVCDIFNSGCIQYSVKVTVFSSDRKRRYFAIDQIKAIELDNVAWNSDQYRL